MIYQKQLLLLFLLLTNIALFAQSDTIDMSSEKERQAILEEMGTAGKTEKIRTKKDRTAYQTRGNIWAIKTAPFAMLDLNFPSVLLDVEYQMARKIGIVAGAGWVKGAGTGTYANTDPDQRGFRANASLRFYWAKSDTWDFYLAPKVEVVRAWADKEVLALQASGGFLQVREITAITRAMDIQGRLGWQYISKQGFLCDINMGGGIRRGGIFPTKEFADVNLNSSSSSFFRQGVQQMNLSPILRVEARVGWAFGLKK